DAALAHVLVAAARLAGCAAHLGIVHIEESGWAEYNGGYRGRGWEHGSRYGNDDSDEEADDSEFEIGEVCDRRQFIDQWRNADDRPAAFGEIPLDDYEVLPPGALDN